MARELEFFFQAEDGIRDIGVTGVQTCALPILQDGPRRQGVQAGQAELGQRAGDRGRTELDCRGDLGARPLQLRSEERRVGKECRFRWLSERYKAKTEGAQSGGAGGCSRS